MGEPDVHPPLKGRMVGSGDESHPYGVRLNHSSSSVEVEETGVNTVRATGFNIVTLSSSDSSEPAASTGVSTFRGVGCRTGRRTGARVGRGE